MSCEKPSLSFLLSSGDSTTLTVLVAVGLGAFLLGSLLTIIVEAYRRRWRQKREPESDLPSPSKQQYCTNCRSKENSPGLEDTFMHPPPFSPCSLSATFNRQSIKPPMNMFNHEPAYGQWPAQSNTNTTTTSTSNQISLKVSAPTEETTYQEVVIQKFQKRSKTDLENWHLGPRASGTRSSSISSNEGSTSNTVVGGSSINTVTNNAEKPTFARSKSEPRHVGLEYDPFRKSSISTSSIVMPSSPPPTDHVEFHPVTTNTAPRKPQPAVTRYDVSTEPHVYRRKSESRISQATKPSREDQYASFGSDVPAGRLRTLSTPQRPSATHDHDHQSYSRTAVPEFPPYPRSNSSGTRWTTDPIKQSQSQPQLVDHLQAPRSGGLAFPRKQPSPISPAESSSSGEGDRSSQLLPDAMAVSFYKEHANKHLSLPSAGIPNVMGSSAVLPDSPSGVRGDSDRDSEVDFSLARGRAI